MMQERFGTISNKNIEKSVFSSYADMLMKSLYTDTRTLSCLYSPGGKLLFNCYQFCTIPNTFGKKVTE